MITRKPLLIAMGLMAMALSYPQKSAAETFTGAAFLEWETESQDSYIQTSVGMAAVIAAQISAEKADCLGEWYFPDTSKRHDEIRATMREHSGFHPQGVILAFLQKACGKFGL